MGIDVRLMGILIVSVVVVVCISTIIKLLTEEDLRLARQEELKALDSLLDEAQKRIEFLAKENFRLKERIAELEAQLKEQRE